MADLVSEITNLTKGLTNQEFKSSEDVRKGLEDLRRFLVVTGEVIDIFDHQLTMDLTYAAVGNRRRARQVTRPLRLASTLVLAANRRVRTTWTNFNKVFSEELSATRRSDRRDPFKFER